MKIECTIRRDVVQRLADGTPVRIIGTEVPFDGEDGPVVYHFKPSEGDERHLAEVKDETHARRLLSITESFAPADDEAAKIAAIVGKRPEDDFADPEITGKRFEEAGLKAMKYPALKKLAVERFGLQLAANASKDEYVVAILNAQG